MYQIQPKESYGKSRSYEIYSSRPEPSLHYWSTTQVVIIAGICLLTALILGVCVTFIGITLTQDGVGGDDPVSSVNSVNPPVRIRPGINMRQLSALKLRIHQMILENNSSMLGELVRLAFHDCVGDEGCNGCVDHLIKANFGLDSTKNIIEPLYYSTLSYMGISLSEFTLADWYALCGIAAVEKGFANARLRNFADFKFKIGRPVKPTCFGDTRDEWPDSNGDFVKSMAFLSNQFGFNQLESVVALGGHALGHTNLSNSGHVGAWTNEQHSLDNVYYKNMLKAVKENWHQFKTIHPKDGRPYFQWTDPQAPPGDDPIVMLNSDIILVKDLLVDGHGLHGAAQCQHNISQCPDSVTITTVKRLAHDNAYFARMFVRIWTKMLHKVPKDVSLYYPYDY